ncbi:nitrile hydratase accessory protein [Hoeflea sp. Naph1]|uniref:nitrile hydratase accessory protein n=1 Tax=Hoeflea sp. Naph1 TaxID=3388653 RepID=UPI00398F9C09
MVDDLPPFEAPWQAQTFACTMELSKRGYFAWSDWVSRFSQEIKTKPQRDGETVNEAYHRQWLSALEALLLSHDLCSSEEIANREEDWRKAYHNTPHGLPIELSAAYSAPCKPKSHHLDIGKPVAISPASR